MKSIAVPAQVQAVFDRGGTVAISISGGKDGQAMLRALVAQLPAAVNKIAVHADLGRTEWPQTPQHVERMAAEAGLQLVVVRRARGDMIDRWHERMVKLKGTGKPFWSSAKNRYCTSDMKRGPIDIHLRKYQAIISAEGLRAQESVARAKKPVLKVRDQIDNNSRTAYTWNPILDWSLDDVWAVLGTSGPDVIRRRALWAAGEYEAAMAGWQAHPAYVMGNERLSCVICILGSRNDMRNGARHNPETARLMLAMEQESGATFRQDLSLAQIIEEA